MKYLLDTDTCIQALRGISGTVSRFEAESADDLAISSITYYELLNGVKLCIKTRQEKEMARVEAFVRLIHVIPFGSATAHRAAEVRRYLEEKGFGICPMDTLIAATALDADLILVSGNLREFDRIEALRCENWIR